MLVSVGGPVNTEIIAYGSGKLFDTFTLGFWFERNWFRLHFFTDSYILK